MGDDDLSHLRNKRFGFVFQTFHLLTRFTALENVALPLFYAGVGRQKRQKIALEALNAVGLSDRVAHLPSQLSGGQQQRVAIARALVNQPDLIFADEPTGNLDSQSGGEIINLLLRLNQQGHTVIIVTHDPAIAEKATRKIVLKDGRITG